MTAKKKPATAKDGALARHKTPKQRVRAKKTKITRAKKRADKLSAWAEAYGSGREAQAARYASEQLFEHNNIAFLSALRRLKRFPVPIEEFVMSKEFLGDQIDCWPSILEELKKMNPDVLCGEAPVYEIIYGGATGTAKTFMSSITNAYQAYLLTCFNQPQRLYNMSPQTAIVFLMISVSSTVTRRVIYKPFRDMFVSMPFTKRYIPYDKTRESTLLLDENIEITPALASVQAMLGQAVVGGTIDEVNFMQIVENSKSVPGPDGLGGHYDQAELTYRTLSRRRKSRFVTQGPSAGSICIVSSTAYKGDFIDRRIAEVEQFDEQNVYVYRRKQYDVVPEERFSGDVFEVLVGSDTYPTRILTEQDEEGITYPAKGTVEEVPVEYLGDFQRDPDNALRDIIGVATDSLSPFIRQRNKIVDAVLRGNDVGLRQWVDKQDVNLTTDGMPQWNEDVLNEIQDKHRYRFAHIDLSRSHDACGIAICKCVGFENRVVDNDWDTVEVVPMIHIECTVQIQPSPMNQIDIPEIRRWLFQLKAMYGIELRSVTYDGFDSNESIQMWRKSGIRSELISMDKGIEPYEYLRDLYYQDCLAQIEHEKCREELVRLEHNQVKKMVDHPPRGSKDVADAVAGAVFTCGKSRDIRNAIGFHDTEGKPKRSRRNKRRSGHKRR